MHCSSNVAYSSTTSSRNVQPGPGQNLATDLKLCSVFSTELQHVEGYRRGSFQVAHFEVHDLFVSGAQANVCDSLHGRRWPASCSSKNLEATVVSLRSDRALQEGDRNIYKRHGLTSAHLESPCAREYNSHATKFIDFTSKFDAASGDHFVQSLGSF